MATITPQASEVSSFFCANGLCEHERVLPDMKFLSDHSYSGYISHSIWFHFPTEEREMNETRNRNADSQQGGINSVLSMSHVRETPKLPGYSSCNAPQRRRMPDLSRKAARTNQLVFTCK